MVIATRRETLKSDFSLARGDTDLKVLAAKVGTDLNCGSTILRPARLLHRDGRWAKSQSDEPVSAAS
jgi:hypothetical protein